MPDVSYWSPGVPLHPVQPLAKSAFVSSSVTSVPDWGEKTTAAFSMRSIRVVSAVISSMFSARSSRMYWACP